MIAIIDAYKKNLLTYKNWYPNLIAGLIVGIVALPLAMAFAIASGVKPEQGLYTAIIAGILVGLFGGTRVQIAGPTGAFVIILASITAKYGINGLQTATMLAGVILILMGLIKLGNVIKFIPDPVIVGFTTGIGFIIFVGEWKDFFGLNVHISLDASFYQKFFTLLNALPHLNFNTTLLSIISLVVVLITPRIAKRIPGPLVAIIVSTILQWYLHLKGVATLGSMFGGIPQRLPSFHMPNTTFNQMIELAGPAFTIALLGAIESLLSATAADGMCKTKHSSNQELIGQGIANIATPLFGGFAATGAIARTATNVRNGGNSPLAAIVHSLFLLLVIVLIAPLAFYIPLCALAAILMVVAYNMSDVPYFIHIIRDAPWYDVVVLLITFFLTIFVNLVVAVNVGIIFAMLFFIQRMSQFVSVRELPHEKLHTEVSAKQLEKLPKNTLIYTIQGPFFFGAAEKIEHVFSTTHTDPVNIIFRLKDVPFIDMTGLETFYEIIDQFHQRGVHVYLCEANAIVASKLLKANIVKLIKYKKIFHSLSEVIQTF